MASQFDLKEYVPEASETVWYNPTGSDMALKLYVGVERAAQVPGSKKKSPWLLYVVPAKGERKIPSEFDTAIQDVRAGVIMGGKGPRLVNRSRTEPVKLHEALDPEAQELKRQADLVRENEMVQKGAAAAVASLLATHAPQAVAAPAPTKSK